MPTDDATQRRREWIVGVLLALTGLIAAEATSAMGTLLLPAALPFALVVPIVLRPRGLAAWLLGFSAMIVCLLGLLCVTSFMAGPLLAGQRGRPSEVGWSLLGYAGSALLVGAGSLAGSVLLRASERAVHAVRVGVLMALTYPVTAVIYWLLVKAGLPLSS